MSNTNKNIGRSMTPTRLSSLLLGRGRRTNSSQADHHLVEQLCTVNLLDQSLTEETKRKFKERRHQSQSPNRSRRSSSTGRQEHLQYQQSLTIDMSNGRPMTPERRQQPPSSAGSASSSTGTSPHNVSFRQTAATAQQEQQNASARFTTPPPPRRMNPFLIGRCDSAKLSTVTISGGSGPISSSSSSSSTTAGLPSRLSASAVRARSISPGWNRRRNNLPRSTNNIETYTQTNRMDDRSHDNNSINQCSTKVHDQQHHVSFSDTIAAAAKEKEVQKQLSVLEKTVSDQKEQIKFYEGRLKGGTQELSQLNRELADRRLKQAQLELELEVHDSKFSVYDDYRRLLDTRRLVKQTFQDDDDDDKEEDDDKDERDGSRMEGRNDSNIASTDRAVDSDRRTKIHGNERDLSAVLSKLERFESTMKKFEQEADKQYSELNKEYKRALAKIDSLEKSSGTKKEETIRELRLSKTQSSDDGVSDGGHSVLSTTISDPINDLLRVTKNNNDHAARDVNEGTAANNFESSSESLLRKRIKVLEAENARQSLNIHSLHEEIDRLKAIQNDTTSFQREEEMTTLRRENTVLVNRVAALETELGYTMGHIGDKTRSRRYRALEKNMNEYTVEIMSLEDKLRAKDSVISRLKERDLSRRLGMAGVDESLVLLPSSSKHDDASSVETSSSMVKPLRNSTTGQKILHQIKSNEDDDNGDFDDLFAPGPDLLKSRMNKRMEELKKTQSTQPHGGSMINTSSSDESSLSSSSTNNNSKSIASTSGSERVAMLRKRLGELSKINEKHMKEEVSS